MPAKPDVAAPQIVRTISALRAIVSAWRQQGQSIGVVPTMGALHEGHLSLVRQALSQTDRVLVTLFVNPKQFNNSQDLAAYPRTEHDDKIKLTPLGVPVLFCPSGAEIYPQGFSTTVSVAGVSQGLCGAGRPGHFDGVATVVTKLLLICGADRAFFGEKDFQQLMVVRRLVADLNIPTQIVGCPTVREPDGLALSSRNARLTPSQRKIAPALAGALADAARHIAEGADVALSIETARQRLLAAGYDRVEYLELRAEDDLAPITKVELNSAGTNVLLPPARLLAAAWLDQVRLIDNIKIPASA